MTRQRTGTGLIAICLGALLAITGCGYSPYHGFPDREMGSGPPRRATIAYPVIIAWPVNGSTVTSPFAMVGDGTAVGGQLNWSIEDAAGKVVRSGTTIGGSMGNIGPWGVQNVDLPPGEYRAVVEQARMPGHHPDNHGNAMHQTSVTFSVK